MRRRVVVHGRVQGVFFRDTCHQKASVLGVAGWVRNRDDGTVEAVFEGDESAVASMVRWTHEGSATADVERVDVTEEEPRGETGFSVR